MTASDGTIITDPTLLRVLEAAQKARDQCNALLDFLEANPTSATNPTPREVELELSKRQRELNSYVAQIRGLNRAAILGVRQTKQATAEARSEVDTLHLQLQNLKYEQRYIKGEIAACEDYDHAYQRLPLVPKEEFIAQHPEHANDDENALMAARIEHEHQQRKALEEQRQALLKKKQELITENKKRKADLVDLDKNLETWVGASDPIEKIFEKYS